MPKFCLKLFFALSICSAVSAQDNIPNGNAFASDINGRPLYLKTEYRAEGSPYLYEDYNLAEVTTSNGKVYNNVRIKTNLQEKLVIYKLDNGMEMILTTPVKKIKFYHGLSTKNNLAERVFVGHEKALNDDTGKMYEQVFEDSSAALLKMINVTFNDAKAYGEATITRIFTKSEAYFAAIPPTNKNLIKVEKNRTAVAALFGSRAEAVSKFINDKKLKCKTDEELIEVFRYYSSL